jgi:hypothetical protein
MTNFPACRTSPSVTRPTSPAFGGNLAPVNTQYRGHSLLLEQAHDLAAHLPYPNEAAATSLPAVRTGAAIDRRHATAAPSTAKSRPFPLPEVNHVAHFIAPLSSHTEVSNGEFRDDGSAFRQGRKNVHG